MRPLLLFLLFTTKIYSQDFLLVDSMMRPALNLDGYRDTKVNFKFPELKSIDGKIYTTDSLTNKITFINFWFEGCPPCIAEFDALNDLYQKYGSHKDFQFLSFTFETKEDALRISEKHHLNFPIICVEKENIHKLIFNLGFPTTMVINRQGQITFIICGGFAEKEKAKEMVDTIYAKEIDRQLFTN